MKSRLSVQRTLVNVCFVLGLMVTFFGVFNGDVSYSNYQELKKSKSILAKAVADLESRSQMFSLEIDKLKKSPAYATRVLKDKYHYRDGDEQLIFYAK